MTFLRRRQETVAETMPLEAWCQSLRRDCPELCAFNDPFLLRLVLPSLTLLEADGGDSARMADSAMTGFAGEAMTFDGILALVKAVALTFNARISAARVGEAIAARDNYQP